MNYLNLVNVTYKQVQVIGIGILVAPKFVMLYVIYLEETNNPKII